MRGQFGRSGLLIALDKSGCWRAGRGPFRCNGAQDEFTLAAIAQNLCRLARLVARPPRLGAMCVA